ncbi:SusC/RagA family TonB-linked outer membrane protein [Porphyromonadaceae bacterium W3.11]|nr:SusC/RagA family TonB-linked outer membrane protein [Porphyromonadaceae bacterium W3.11]
MNRFLSNIFSIAVLTLLISLPLCAQTEEIMGIVNDEQGLPLPNVTILVVESGQGTASGIHGEFRISAKKGQHLRFSFIGMKTQTVPVTKNKLLITLKEDAQLLDQVIVTGYQKVSSRVYTGAATSVKLDDIKLEGVTDVSRMLEGRVPGLSIQNISGSFGSAPRINIRGGASIIGNVQPLWVIDGAVYEDLVSLTLDQLASGDAVTLISSAVAGINPSDIEDIQVLKDASATSIYGARALNGVIVITTRSGKRNTPIRINYSSEYSIRQKPSYSNFDLLDSQETMSILMEMKGKGHFGLKESLYGRRAGLFHQLYSAVSTFDPNTGEYVLENTPEAQRNFLKTREYANTDWFDHLFTLRPTTNHTISLSGGSEKLATHASLGYFHDAGWTITDAVHRLTGNVKTSFFFNDKLSATIAAQGNIRTQKAPGTIPQRKNTTLGAFERDFDINPFAYALGTSRTLRPKDEQGNYEYYRYNWAPFNILNEYQNNLMNIKVLDLKLQGETSYKITPNIEVKGLFSIRSASTSTEHEIHQNSNIIRAFSANETPEVAKENIFLLHNRENQYFQPLIPLTNGGIYKKSTTHLTSYLGRIALDYNGSFGEHDLKSFFFTEARSTNRQIDAFDGYGIQYDRGHQIFDNPLIFEKLSEGGEDYFKLNKLYNRGITFSWSNTYGYAGKYIFNTILNYEGSNTGGRSTRARWLPTWNVGAKWNIDREDFMPQQSVVSKLAVRTSYGLTAKMNEQALNANAIFQNAIIHRLSIEDRENALKIYNLENRDLSWEKMYEWNVGLDIGLYNNRISSTIDLYLRNAFDLIDLIRTSGVGGEYYKYANFGDMRTLGAEFALHTRNIETKNFQWSSSLTFSYMNQKITRLLNTPNTFDMVAGRGRGNIEGYPKGSLFSFNFQGLTSEGLPSFDFGHYPIDNDTYATSTGADFVDAQYSKTYLLYHGPIEPNMIGGLSNTFRYKGWELSFFITAQAGNKIRLNPTYDPSFGDLNVFSKEYYDRWLVPGDEFLTDIPVIPSDDLIRKVGRENIERAYNTYNYSQNRVADGSFIRMKNITMAYQLPESVLRPLYLQSAVIRFNATNPFLIYSDRKLQGQDPEYYQAGGVSLPTPKQYTITLNLSF